MKCMAFSQRNYARCAGFILMITFSCSVCLLLTARSSPRTHLERCSCAVCWVFFHYQELLPCYEDTIYFYEKQKFSLIWDLWFGSNTKPDNFPYSQTQVWYTETKSVWSQVQTLGMREKLLHICSQRRKAYHVWTLLCWSYGRFSLIGTTLNSSSRNLCQNK